VNWQWMATIVIVLVAAVYVTRSILLPLFRRGHAGCGSRCGRCATPGESPPTGRIRLPQLPSTR
jgi:hypothetical protein